MMRYGLLLTIFAISCSSSGGGVTGPDKQDPTGPGAGGGGGLGPGNQGAASDAGTNAGDGSAGDGSQGPAGNGDCAGDPFDENALRRRITYLASEQLGGRVPGTPGDKAAREHIESYFRCLGLTPAGQGGSYQVPFVNRAGTSTANVVGYIPGSDPAVASDIVLVGAHHDHFGNTGGLGLRLGANDNASGIAGLLAAAHAIRQKGKAPRRTIAFVAFGSEETLTTAPYTEGSAWYVGHAPDALPMSKVVYMINFDMIGSYSQEQLVYAIGSLRATPAYSILSQQTNAGLRMSLGEPGEEGDSDFYPFCTAGVPYVFFWTSDEPCYHKSCDTADRIDFPHLGRIARAASDLTASLGDSSTDLAAFRRSARVSQLGCTSNDGITR